jgi:hypothetical protein
MRASKLLILVVVLGLSVAANAAPLILNLRAVNLSNHWQIRGTITTDGTVGTLTSANIIDWNIQLIQTNDLVWTEADSNALNIAGVSSDGSNLLVTTFPNTFQDGGTLYVGRGGGGGTIPTNAIIADFTQLSRNLGYNGGMAGFQDEILGLNFIGLNKPNGRQYRAATLDPAKPNVFNIKVPQISPLPYKVTMFGTITTDGTVGALQPANLIAWNITARMQSGTTYTPASSAVLYVSNVSYDGTKMLVGRTGGQLVIGIGGARPTYVTLADFTDPQRPNGFANYYVGNFGLQGERSPLIGSGTQSYAVAK